MEERETVKAPTSRRKLIWLAIGALLIYIFIIPIAYIGPRLQYYPDEYLRFVLKFSLPKPHEFSFGIIWWYSAGPREWMYRILDLGVWIRWTPWGVTLMLILHAVTFVSPYMPFLRMRRALGIWLTLGLILLYIIISACVPIAASWIV